jgi:hypothetical protein
MWAPAVAFVAAAVALSKAPPSPPLLPSMRTCAAGSPAAGLGFCNQSLTYAARSKLLSAALTQVMLHGMRRAPAPCGLPASRSSSLLSTRRSHKTWPQPAFFLCCKDFCGKLSRSHQHAAVGAHAAIVGHFTGHCIVTGFHGGCHMLHAIVCVVAAAQLTH